MLGILPISMPSSDGSPSWFPIQQIMLLWEIWWLKSYLCIFPRIQSTHLRYGAIYSSPATSPNQSFFSSCNFLSNNCTVCNTGVRYPTPNCTCVDNYFEDYALGTCSKCDFRCLTCITNSGNCLVCNLTENRKN